jgi:hypothetical protein
VLTLLNSNKILNWLQTTKAFSLQRIALILVLFLLAGCSFQAVEIQQEQASGLAGELLDGRSFGQTFTPEHDSLSRIDLYTATYARENTQPVIFRIGSAPGEQGEALLRLELPAAQISNSGPTVITFPPLPDTEGKRLYFSIESPGSTTGDAITVYREEGDVYPEGQMYVDGEATEGDLAFIAYTEESFTLGDVWDDFYSRASQDRPFFIFYCSILALLLILFVIGLAWSARKRSALEEDEQQS